jgi:thiol-disulfide isomerase/thioredoxin
VSEGKSGSPWGAAILGGIVGGALMLVVLVLAAQAGVGDRFVREAMSRNPEILVETADRLRDRQYAPVLNAQRASLETPFGSSWEGSSTPDVTLVEFYDYACGYCKASLPILDRLIKEDPRLRIVYREFPILGQGSVIASRTSRSPQPARAPSSTTSSIKAAPITPPRIAAPHGVPIFPSLTSFSCPS